MSKPLVVHHLENSRARRILWLLEELQVPYELKEYKRHPKTLMAPPELRAVHPLGKSPVVTDPNNNNLVLAESAAIIEYVVQRYGQGKLVPAEGTPARQRYTYWLHYAEGSLQPLLLVRLIFNRVSNQHAPLFVKPIMRAIDKGITDGFISPQLTLHLSYVDKELSQNPAGWFAGDSFTAADIQMSYPLEVSRKRAGVDFPQPHIEAFLQKIHSRPAYKKALSVTGESINMPLE